LELKEAETGLEKGFQREIEMGVEKGAEKERETGVEKEMNKNVKRFEKGVEREAGPAPELEHSLR